VNGVSKKFKDKTCVYCAKNLSTNTGDHIFAREFFLPNRRHNLPKAPACNQCNNEKSVLEHYLTSVLPFGGRHEDARLNLENVPKRLARNESLHRLLAQRRRTVWGQEKEGLYVPLMALPIKPGSVEKLFEFIVKGLVWHHWQSYLTGEYFVEVQALMDDEAFLFERFFSKISPHLKVSANLGNGTFLYEGFRDIDSPQTTAWRFSLYGGLKLAGGPQERREGFSLIDAFTGPIQILEGAASPSH
jgi:hypothetical protein